MRILQIATMVPYPPTDGGKLSIFGLIKNLSEKGHLIDFICYQKDADYESSITSLQKYCYPHILNFKTDNDIWEAFKNLFSPIPYNTSKYISNLMLDYVNELLKKKEFDVIQINHLHLGWLVSHLKKVTSVPIIMRPQNIETAIMKRYYGKVYNPILKLFSWLQFRKLLKYEPGIYSQFDLCIMISTNDLLQLKKYPSIKAIQIPAGVNEKLLDIERKPIIRHSIAHIGHTDWYPNYDSLNWFITEIFPIVLKKHPDTVLYIYGGGNTKNFQIPVNYKDNIQMKGFVDDLWSDMSEIEVSVVPLRIGGGIRIKILELLASGNAIVSTSIGKEGINVENEKHLLIADTSTTFAEQIIRIFEGYDTSSLISNGREFIRENYIWTKITGEFEDAYYNLIRFSTKRTY